MRIASKSQYHCVCDDVLGRDALAALAEYVRGVRLTGAHAEQYERDWRPEDGNPLFGPSIIAYADAARARKGAQNQFPTHTAIDLVFRELLRPDHRFRRWVGKKSEDWAAIVARLAVYPAGTGLSWHDDTTDSYTGAFSLFIHPHWEFDWGGELLVLDGPTSPRLDRKNPRPSRAADPLRTRTPSARDSTRTRGSFVVPVPNRMVYLKGGILHSINPVRSAAGRVPRIAVSGFFVRSKYVK